jgi:hypothetical protein
MSECIWEGCTEDGNNKGYCKKHYDKWYYKLCREKAGLAQYTNQNPIRKRTKITGTCNVEGCDSQIHCKGVCYRHYLHLRNHGEIRERTRITPNDFIIDGDTCKIGCYNIYCDLVGYALIDAEDVDRCKPHKWYFEVDGYVSSTTAGSLHHFILGTKPRSGVFPDHKNRVCHDNRKDNLRIATTSQNACNSKINSRNKTGYKGVYFNGKEFVVYICSNGKNNLVGKYNTKEEAAMIYNQKAKELHGEFAFQNTLKESVVIG